MLESMPMGMWLKSHQLGFQCKHFVMRLILPQKLPAGFSVLTKSSQPGATENIYPVTGCAMFKCIGRGNYDNGFTV